MKVFLKHATEKSCVHRSVKVALLVGFILALINHYEAIINRTLTATNIFQILLTFLIPFMVATYGSAMHARCLELQEVKR